MRELAYKMPKLRTMQIENFNFQVIWMFHSIATGKKAYKKSEPISNAEKAYPSLVIAIGAMQVPVPEAGFHANLSGRH